MNKLIALIALLIVSGLIFAQTVANETQLRTAITNAPTSGAVIEIANSFVVSNTVTIGKSLTINGHGYEISVPRPGLDDMGRFNSDPSSFATFYVTGTLVTINDLRIKGGYYSSSGGAIQVIASTTLKLDNCIVSNSRAARGGGIYVEGVLYMNNSYLRRNAAEYGGGLLLVTGARAYIENSTMIENRSVSSGGGGGAVECQSGAIIYFNNSTLANNQSTEIGGAINNRYGTVYFINSSATGNVAFGGYPGGAIGNNNGNVYIVNSLFAHNYRMTTGDVTNPTGYILDDFVAYEPFYNAQSQAKVNVYYSVYHATMPSGMGTNSNNIQYTGLNDGSDNTIFSGGLLSKITDNNGNEIGDQVFRPFLYEHSGSVAPTLRPGSFITEAGNRGTPTRFSNNNNDNPAIAYYPGYGVFYVDLLGTSSAGQQVLIDQVNQTRSATAPARGAIETETAATLCIVKVNGASGGTVTGGTIYGDVYAYGTQASITAIPNASQTFVRWDFVAGDSGTASTNNPYTFTVNRNVTLIPVFQASSGGRYSIIYVGNGNTSGTPPVSQTYTSSTLISDQGTMLCSGYNFDYWNTSSNGSGVSYLPGATYTAGANITLYAQWNTFDFPVNVYTDHDQMVIHPTVDLNQDHNIDANNPIITSLPNYATLGTIKVVGLVGTGNSVNIDVTVPAGDWYGSIYYNGDWHLSTPNHIQATAVSRIVTFTGVSFAAKAGEVIILLNGDNGTTLPVELSSFTATFTVQNYVTLNWVAESETNLSGYYIYRSNENELATALCINNMIAAENTSHTTSYSYIDNEVIVNDTYYYWLQALEMDGTLSYHGPISITLTDQEDENQTETPTVTCLLQNYPNPFNPTTCLVYYLKSPETVTFRMYNAKGQLVRSYLQQHATAGRYNLVFDGLDSHGKTLSSGIYYCVMKAGTVTSKIKMIMLK